MSEITGSAGQVLAERYRLVSLIGRGGMGSVWRAEHLSLGTPVAIKLVHPSMAERPGMRGRFLREAQAAARLRSVNVVQILDHGIDGGVPYIAMECLEGESLAQRLHRERKLGTAATALVMAGVCRALAGAHRAGIVHRDLKPDNIFIARDEAGPIVKVLDFGIAKVIDSPAVGANASTETSDRTETGTLLGTPRYMSPEQARAHKTLDGRSDLWSLAVIAFECLTGRPPFDADLLSTLVLQICSDPVPVPSSIAECPPGFDAWFARATQRDPAARFQTVQGFADALAEVLTPGKRWLDALDAVAPGGAAPGSPDLQTETTVSLIQKESAPAARSRLPLFLGAPAVALAIAAVGFTASRAPKAQAGAPASAEPPPTSLAPVPSTAPSAAPTPTPTVAVTPAETRRVNLVVLPKDASVEVDGAPARSRGGVVQISGKLGSVRRVRVWKGKAELEGDVIITESGAIPTMMDLSAARPKGPPKPTRVDNFDE